ncbi:DUF4129 domain-containing protein [Thermopolyspora sp. NPDC052614]|uniref:DUF4129 domain-containing protein n=1 Tax=Thermopolyspora sp. NPDC052614 TaxID=3155682 RepID=UPI0034484443
MWWGMWVTWGMWGTITADPVGVEREEAARRAVTELLDPGYQQESLPDRFLRIVYQFIGDLTDAVASGDGGVFALVALFVIIGGLLALLLWHARRATRRSAATQVGVLAGQELSAAEHREAAERFAASGEWAHAIRERLRAIARDLQERAILDASPGRTADELATAAGRELPALAAELTAAARVFDDVTYGDRPGTADGYARLARLDEQVAAARPAAGATPLPSEVTPR